MLTVLALAFLAQIVAAPTPTSSPGLKVVVLTDGTRYDLAKPYEVRGNQARLQLVNGPLVSVPVAQIDVEASRRAAAPPTPTPTPAAPPHRTPMTITSVGSPGSGASRSWEPVPTPYPVPTSSTGTLRVPAPMSSSGSSSGSSGTSSDGASAPKGGPVLVKGYTRKDGTYVAPYTRSAPKKK